MADKYVMKSTSRKSAVIQDRILSETSTTRRVLRPEVVENIHDPKAGVKVTLVHQRKSPRGEWEDTAAIRLSELKAGEGVKLAMGCAETLNLYNELVNIFAISASAGVRQGQTPLVVSREDEVILADPERARVINKLLAQKYPDQVWVALVETNPNLVTRLSYARVHEERSAALTEFQDMMAAQKPEGYWEDLFEKNNWIFGYGLNYQILRTVQRQPHYGGTSIAGKGEQRGDYLLRTGANVKFTVLVEIKKPDTPLLGTSQYRNGAWKLGEELIGGVTQLQANSLTWGVEGPKNRVDRETLIRSNIYTNQPKGILVIGNTDQLTDAEKRDTFESFRRNIFNPEIITFDELFERAKFIVEHRS